LIGLVAPFLAEGGRCLLHKGERADLELTRARKLWHMRLTRRASVADSRGTILIISQVRPRKAKKKRP
jgi:hypothetical protein